MSSLAETSWAIKDDLIQPSSVAQRSELLGTHCCTSLLSHPECAAVAKFKE
jgi:hypothetical protein